MTDNAEDLLEMEGETGFDTPEKKTESKLLKEQPVTPQVLQHVKYHCVELWCGCCRR